VHTDEDYYFGAKFWGRTWDEEGSLLSRYRIDRHFDLPVGITLIQKLEYCVPNVPNCYMHLLIPRGAEGPLPTVLYVPSNPGLGLAWDANADDFLLPVALATRGYVVAVVKYRSAGDHHFPAQLFDCRSAVRMLKALGTEKWSIDPNRIGVVGLRAGGHLAGLLALTSGRQEFDEFPGRNKYSEDVQAACMVSAPVDLSHIRKFEGNGPVSLDPADPNSSAAQFLGGKLGDNPEKLAQVNPLTYIGKQAPPMLIVHAEDDSEVPLADARQLYEAFHAAGAKARLYVAPRAKYARPFVGFDEEVVAEVADFLDAQLKTEPAQTPTK
jgi:acetyl esterase/lipase